MHCRKLMLSSVAHQCILIGGMHRLHLNSRYVSLHSSETFFRASRRRLAPSSASSTLHCHSLQSSLAWTMSDWKKGYPHHPCRPSGQRFVVVPFWCFHFRLVPQRVHSLVPHRLPSLSPSSSCSYSTRPKSTVYERTKVAEVVLERVQSTSTGSQLDGSSVRVYGKQ